MRGELLSIKIYESRQDRKVAAISKTFYVKVLSTEKRGSQRRKTVGAILIACDLRRLDLIIVGALQKCIRLPIRHDQRKGDEKWHIQHYIENLDLKVLVK